MLIVPIGEEHEYRDRGEGQCGEQKRDGLHRAVTITGCSP
jgi:hypothetical protein